MAKKPPVSPFPQSGTGRQPQNAFFNDMKLGLILNNTISGTQAAVAALRLTAAKLGVEILPAASKKKPDFYLVLGGDGSVLRAVHAVGADSIPLVNINIGSLGYLTCAGLEDLDKVLACLLDGSYAVSERAMLKASVRDGKGREICPPALALNDVVAMRGDSGRIVGIEVCVDGVDVTEFLCDGLIVATPTGSTAYSLSAGGPIVLPETRAMLISVICPHTLTSRPLVLPGTSEIVLRIARAESPLAFSVDGQVGTSLRRGDAVHIAAAAHRVRLAMLPGHNPFSALSLKLNWSGTLIK